MTEETTARCSCLDVRAVSQRGHGDVGSLMHGCRRRGRRAVRQVSVSGAFRARWNLDAGRQSTVSIDMVLYRVSIQRIVIIGFRHKALEAFYTTGTIRDVQADHVKKLRNILGLLSVAAGSADINIPSFKLHPLKGDLKGHWSVWVNDNWRVTFRFVGADAELVDYQDYH